MRYLRAARLRVEIPGAASQGSVQAVQCRAALWGRLWRDCVRAGGVPSCVNPITITVTGVLPPISHHDHGRAMTRAAQSIIWQLSLLHTIAHHLHLSSSKLSAALTLMLLAATSSPATRSAKAIHCNVRAAVQYPVPEPRTCSDGQCKRGSKFQTKFQTPDPILSQLLPHC